MLVLFHFLFPPLHLTPVRTRSEKPTKRWPHSQQWFRALRRDGEVLGSPPDTPREPYTISPPGRSPWEADKLQAETFPDLPGKQSDGEIMLQ